MTVAEYRKQIDRKLAQAVPRFQAQNGELSEEARRDPVFASVLADAYAQVDAQLAKVANGGSPPTELAVKFRLPDEQPAALASAVSRPKALAYEDMTFKALADLKGSDPARFDALAADWERRGKPKHRPVADAGAGRHNGMAYEEMTFQALAELRASNPAAEAQIKANWEARGKPKAKKA